MGTMVFFRITLRKLPLTCTSCGDDFGLASSSIPLRGVSCHSDRVSRFGLQATNDGFLRHGNKIAVLAIEGIANTEPKNICGKKAKNI